MRLFTLSYFLVNYRGTPHFRAFFHGLVHVLGDFFKNSSRHPGVVAANSKVVGLAPDQIKIKQTFSDGCLSGLRGAMAWFHSTRFVL
jgi:hypothetical protein